jgi:hypothetical protein
MKFTMTGHDKRKVQYVSAKFLKDKFSQTKGYFHSEFDWNESGDPIVLKIKSTIYIDDALTGKAKTDVEAHENKHFEDFKALATKMKAAVDQALKAGRGAQLGDRIEWLTYDRCVKSAEFHRKAGGYSVERCDTPGSKRPT